LSQWQHISPTEKLSGKNRYHTIFRQLQAYPLLAQILERDILPHRITDYDSAELDVLCNSGELIWIGRGEKEPKRSIVKFIFRGEGHTYLSPPGIINDNLSKEGQEVYQFLKSEGAIFFSDFLNTLGIGQQHIRQALVELIMCGLITNDSTEAMRQILVKGIDLSKIKKDITQRRSSLATQLSQLPPRGRSFRKNRQKVKETKQQVSKRLRKQATFSWFGRWSIVHRSGVMGKEISETERSVLIARQSLLRYGIVSREIVTFETETMPWPLIYQQFKLMEMRGEVRRGLFVKELSGIQFATPPAVERLRECSSASALNTTIHQPLILSAADPANVYSLVKSELLQAETGRPLTFSRNASTWLIQHQGFPILLVEANGKKITTIKGVSNAQIDSALRTTINHLKTFRSRFTIFSWNEQPVLQVSARSILEQIGFYHTPKGMIYYF
jgi:ATP-dependent Lhr-like helicase